MFGIGTYLTIGSCDNITIVDGKVVEWFIKIEIE
jgi:hypothetical protein